MADNTHTTARHNRTLRYIVLALCLIPLVLLALFASKSVKFLDLHTIRQQVEAVFTRQETLSTSSYVLQAQYAEQETDVDGAADFYAQAFNSAQKEGKTDAQILAHNALESAVLAGDIEQAFTLLRHTEADHFLTHLLYYLHYVASIDTPDGTHISAAQHQELSMLVKNLTDHKLAKHFPELTAFTLPVMNLWLDNTHTDNTAFPLPKEKALARYAQYQKLLYSSHGDTGNRTEIINALTKQNQPFRFIETAIYVLQHDKKPKQAKALLTQYMQGQPPFKPQQDLENIYLEHPHIPIQHPVLDNGADPKIVLAELFLDMAEYALHTQQARKAVVYAQLSLYLNPKRYHTYLLLASVFEFEENYPKTIAYLKQVPKETLLYWRTQFNLADIYYKEGSKKEAIALLNQFNTQHPDLSDGVLALADIYMREKHYREAVRLYQQVIDRTAKIEDNSWSLLYAAGLCYDQLGEWEKAEPLFLQALKAAPNHPDILNYLGYSWLIKNKNIQEAELMLKKAISLSPNAAHIIDSYGWALFKLGRYEEALNYLEYANMLVPYDPTVNDHLGDVLWKLSRYREAYFQWDRALFFKPDPEDLRAIKRKIKHGYTDTSGQS